VHNQIARIFSTRMMPFLPPCSEEEEKGVDCIPQFKNMQECFLDHPEEYGKFVDEEDEAKDRPSIEGGTPPQDAVNSAADSSPASVPDVVAGKAPSQTPGDTPLALTENSKAS
jgi:intermembrane space import and assembly protein 40